ncbi:MAG: hypothetical protein JNK85_02195 [Verrucomicrobiales bacterium]|nr:hypothetical protein [Verrucomicrobiales bacterium]
MMLLLGCLAGFGHSFATRGDAFELRSRERVAITGGSLMVAIERSGALETLAQLAWPDLKPRFRGLAWEGDTVDRQPRDVNFPRTADWLKRSGATMVFVGFGHAECLAGEQGLELFRAAYRAYLDEIQSVVPRVVMVIPPPFERREAPMPDLGARNADLGRYAMVIRELASARGLRVLDFLAAFERERPRESWTTDGRELSEAGHRWLARQWIREMGAVEWAERAAAVGFWDRDDVRRLRAAIVEKNQLWFRYWRPTNWAFLHGDRVEQPSSRDHRDPKVRWFPAEMEQYPPLIAEAEVRIESLAAQAAASRGTHE